MAYPDSRRAWIKSKLSFSYSHSFSKSSMMNSTFGVTQVGWMALMSFPITLAVGNFLFDVSFGHRSRCDMCVCVCVFVLGNIKSPDASSCSKVEDLLGICDWSFV